MNIHVRESITNFIAIGAIIFARHVKQGLKRAFLFGMAATLVIAGQFEFLSTPVHAADSTVSWPVDVKAEQWRIIQGYNNSSLGGDHGGSNPSQLYGFDLQRTDGSSADQSLYSPVSGQVESNTYPTNDGTGVCIVIDLSNFASPQREASLCHMTPDKSKLGHYVDRGTYLGTIAHTANHLHFNLRDWDGSSYTPIPFNDPVGIQGCRDFPSDGSVNQYAGYDISCEQPGGWWEGNTPTDGSYVNYGSQQSVSVKAVDNGNGGLQKVVITEKQDGGSWLPIYTQQFSTYTTSADVSSNFFMPLWDAYISFDVYTNNGLVHYSPMGERHVCYLATPCTPASTASGTITFLSTIGGGGSTQDGTCIPGTNQASIFTDPNYGGQCQILNSGYYPNPSYISLPNDSISSVKIGSGAQLELCRDDNYSNTCEWFSSDNSDLSYTSIGTDQASSAQVQSPDMPTCTPGTNQASFFVDDHFKGQCVTKDVGIYNDMNAIGTIPDNSVSSVKIGAGVKLEMCQDNNLSNTCQLLDSGDFDFGGLAIGNDQMSSAAVIADGSQPNLPNPACVYDSSRSGVLLYQGPNYTGSCVFLTSDVNDLTSTQFAGAQSVRILGTYLNYYQAIGYSDTNFVTTCGTFTADTTDLGSCDGTMKSIRVSTYTPAQLANNIASYAQRDQPNSGAAVDNDLTTEWVGGHQVPLSFVYSSPQTMQEIVVFDRAQSSTDDNQENSIQLTFSDGTQIKYIGMVSGGPRCADVRFPAKAVSWVVVEPYDASGNNGFREVQIWDNSGTVHSSITCPNIVNGSFVPRSDGKLPQFQNIAPTIADQWYTVQEKQPGQVTISATQPGGLALTMSASNLPTFASFQDNGNGSATLNLTPQAGQAGSYDIPVVASNGTASSTATVHVTITPAPVAPTSVLTVSPTSGTAPVTVMADASSSTQGTNPIASYTFDFGDGTAVGPQISALANHAYTTPGTYSVKVTVTDSIGLTNATTQSVTINAAPPTAMLSLSPTSGIAPVSVTADASTSAPGSYPISQYSFNFGDGTIVGPQSGAIASHTYAAGGTYSVTVTITDTHGQTATTTQNVSVAAAPAVFENFQSGIGSWTVTGNVSAATAGPNTYMQFALKANKASTASRNVGTAALSQYGKITMRINLNSATLPTDTGSQFYLKQGTSVYAVSLSSYVTQGASGWQTITIPLSDFVGFNKASSFSSLGYNFLASKAMTVYVDDITFAN